MGGECAAVVMGDQDQLITSQALEGVAVGTVDEGGCLSGAGQELWKIGVWDLGVMLRFIREVAVADDRVRRIGGCLCGAGVGAH